MSVPFFLYLTDLSVLLDWKLGLTVLQMKMLDVTLSSMLIIFFTHNRQLWNSCSASGFPVYFPVQNLYAVSFVMFCLLNSCYSLFINAFLFSHFHSHSLSRCVSGFITLLSANWLKGDSWWHWWRALGNFSTWPISIRMGTLINYDLITSYHIRELG